MTAFAIAIAAQFADPNHAVAALYRAGGSGAGVAVRVILRSPDGFAGFGERRFRVETVMVKVRTQDVADPSAGDTFEVAGERWRVQGAPARDALRLVWSCEAVVA